MNGEDPLTLIERLLGLGEKYGVTPVLLFISIFSLIYVLRMVLKGDLVPRWMLDKVEEDRDEAMEILKGQETGALKEILEFMKKIKVNYKDSSGGSD